MNIMGRGNDGALDRVLDLPTNEAWIDPWVKHLKSLGVRFETGQKIEALEMRGGRVAAARAARPPGAAAQGRGGLVLLRDAGRAGAKAVVARRPRRRSQPGADERALPRLDGRSPVLPEARRWRSPAGHLTFLDSPWAITALTQGQFWEDRDFRRDYGDGEVVDCLSVRRLRLGLARDPLRQDGEALHPERGRARGLGADQSAPRRHRRVVLPTDVLHSWFLDPGVRWHPERRRNSNATPLLVNTVGSWEKRPKAQIAIPNLFLGGDYVQTDIDLATMEGANESAREAVNALLEVSGSKAEPAAKYKLYDPPEFEAAKAADAELFRQGQPNALDTGP